MVFVPDDYNEAFCIHYNSDLIAPAGWDSGVGSHFVPIRSLRLHIAALCCASQAAVGLHTNSTSISTLLKLDGVVEASTVNSFFALTLL